MESASPNAIEEGSRPESELVPVPKVSLRACSAAGFSMFLRSGDSRSASAEGEEGQPAPTAATEEDAQSRSHLLMRSEDIPAYRRYLELNLAEILENPEWTTLEKCELMYQAAQGLMATAMQDPLAKGLLARCMSLVETTLKFLRSDEAPFRHFLNIVSFEYHTYTHSVNVFLFSVALALRVGYGDREELQDLALGALLLDIGKSRVPPEILRCRGKLTTQQWSVMKRHPDYGCLILRSHDVRSPVTLDIVRHHHEKLNGRGYPDGLTASELPTYVRIVTIADIFDALTTVRPYKGALRSFDALKLMTEEMRAELDWGLFRSFVELMSDRAPTD